MNAFAKEAAISFLVLPIVTYIYVVWQTSLRTVACRKAPKSYLFCFKAPSGLLLKQPLWSGLVSARAAAAATAYPVRGNGWGRDHVPLRMRSLSACDVRITLDEVPPFGRGFSVV